MLIKECNDKYGYGCKTRVEYEKDEDLASTFHFTKGYPLNVCKKCEARHYREQYKEGKFPYKKRREYDESDYGTMTTSRSSGFGE